MRTASAARARITNGLANWAAARTAPVLTRLRRSMPRRQLDLDKFLSLVWMMSLGPGASAPNPNSHGLMIVRHFCPQALRPSSRRSARSAVLGGAAGAYDLRRIPALQAVDELAARFGAPKRARRPKADLRLPSQAPKITRRKRRWATK